MLNLFNKWNIVAIASNQHSDVEIVQECVDQHIFCECDVNAFSFFFPTRFFEYAGLHSYIPDLLFEFPNFVQISTDARIIRGPDDVYDFKLVIRVENRSGQRFGQRVIDVVMLEPQEGILDYETSRPTATLPTAGAILDHECTDSHRL